MLMKYVAFPPPFWSEVYKHVKIKEAHSLNVPFDALLCFLSLISLMSLFHLLNPHAPTLERMGFIKADFQQESGVIAHAVILKRE